MANYTGEPIADRKPEPERSPDCRTCDGPCRLPSWARDGSFYSNNPGKFDMAVAHNHSWFEEPWLKGVRIAQAANRAAVRPPDYGCCDCGRFSFPVAGTVCFWCRRRALAPGIGPV